MKVFIKSFKDGFRRCGEAHTRQGREFPDGHFTREQLAQLNADPCISMVAGIPDDEAEHAGTKSSAIAELAAAAGKAVEDGNTVGSGAPTVEAMADILGYGITADQRDAAWAAWKAEHNL